MPVDVDPDIIAVGVDPGFVDPRGIAVDDVGNLVVVDSGLKAVVQVDPETGERTIISMIILDPADDMDMGMGKGPGFVDPRGIAVDGDDWQSGLGGRCWPECGDTGGSQNGRPQIISMFIDTG